VTEAETLAAADAIYLDASALPKIDLEAGDRNGIRLLVLGGRIPLYCSHVALGEFFGVGRWKEKGNRISTGEYLYAIRSFLVDLDMGKIRRVEPVADRQRFSQLVDALTARNLRLGGADIWHIMAALELKNSYPGTTMLTFDQALSRAAAAEGLPSVYGKGLVAEDLVSALSSRGKWVAA
jgi:hypothetical protein